MHINNLVSHKANRMAFNLTTIMSKSRADNARCLGSASDNSDATECLTTGRMSNEQSKLSKVQQMRPESYFILKNIFNISLYKFKVLISLNYFSLIAFFI